MRAIRRRLFLLLTSALILAACRSGPIAAFVPESLKGPRQLAIDINATPKLNTDRKGQPLALVVRIYKLRQRAAFDGAPFDTFVHPAREQETLGADLVEVKEITLVPGQRYRVTEKLNGEIGFIGVVALFHKPAPQRWRAAFAAADVEKSGLTVLAHACSLSSAHSVTAKTPASC